MASLGSFGNRRSYQGTTLREEVRAVTRVGGAGLEAPTPRAAARSLVELEKGLGTARNHYLGVSRGRALEGVAEGPSPLWCASRQMPAQGATPATTPDFNDFFARHVSPITSDIFRSSRRRDTF